MSEAAASPPDAAAAILRAAEELSPWLAEGSARRDEGRILPAAEMDAVRRAGIQAARVPAAHGGPGLGYAALARIMLWLGAGDPNVAQAIQPHFVVLDIIRMLGTPAQQRRYFADVVGGHLINNAFAERGGKVVGEINTRARPDGAGFRLDGTKFYSTGSLVSDQLFVLANTEAGGRLVVILPVGREGMHILDDWDAMGQRTTASGTVELDNVAVAPEEAFPADRLWSERNLVGAGAQVAHAAIDAGIARAALADAVAYARDKARPVPESGVDRAADDPYVVATVGEMSLLATSAEAVVLRAGEVLDRAEQAEEAGEDRTRVVCLQAEASVAVAEAKIAGNQSALRNSELLFNVGGASMTLGAHRFDRHWRNARTHTTHDPVAYKYKVVGDYLLNDRAPPIGTKF